jgi:glucose uptake protein GlcU
MLKLQQYSQLILLSIYATLYLGLTVGFPLTQVALVTSGLWGILLFREISGAKTLIVWTLSVCVLLGGAAMLSLFG